MGGHPLSFFKRWPWRSVLVLASLASSGCSLLFENNPAEADGGLTQGDGGPAFDASASLDCEPVDFQQAKDIGLSPGGVMFSPMVLREGESLFLYYVAYVDSTFTLWKAQLSVNAGTSTLTLGPSTPILHPGLAQPTRIAPGREPGLVYLHTGADLYFEATLASDMLTDYFAISIEGVTRASQRPFLSNGLLLYSEINEATNTSDLAMSQNASGKDWLQPRRLDEINSECDDYGPSMASDGRSLFFNSNRSMSGASCDPTQRVYRSTLSVTGTFTPPILVMELGGMGAIHPFFFEEEGLAAFVYATGANNLMRYVVVECAP